MLEIANAIFWEIKSKTLFYNVAERHYRLVEPCTITLLKDMLLVL